MRGWSSLLLLFHLIAEPTHFMILLSFLIELKVIEYGSLGLEVDEDLDHVQGLAMRDLLGIAGISDWLVLVISNLI